LAADLATKVKVIKYDTAFNYMTQDRPKKTLAPDLTTKVKVLKYKTTVQLFFQQTKMFIAENHPMNLHGYSFYLVIAGFRNYNPVTNPLKFNLVDPPQCNTVIAPVSGWVSIRLKANNPCIYKPIYTSIGLYHIDFIHKLQFDIKSC
jgi:laccase